MEVIKGKADKRIDLSPFCLLEGVWADEKEISCVRRRRKFVENYKGCTWDVVFFVNRLTENTLG